MILEDIYIIDTVKLQYTVPPVEIAKLEISLWVVFNFLVVYLFIYFDSLDMPPMSIYRPHFLCLEHGSTSRFDCTRFIPPAHHNVYELSVETSPLYSRLIYYAP